MNRSTPGVPEVSADLPVPPEQAFRVLEHPDAFRRLVPGARRVRRFDSRWPEAGTKIDHTVGWPPILVRDRTEVVEHDRPRALRLAAHVWPFGQLAVEFLFEPRDGGCRLTVREDPESGPIQWPVLRAATRAVLRLRNREICRRFVRLTGRWQEKASRA